MSPYIVDTDADLLEFNLKYANLSKWFQNNQEIEQIYENITDANIIKPFWLNI